MTANGVGDEGAAAVARLQDAPQLTSLALDLTRNPAIRAFGLAAFAGFGFFCPISLRALTLQLDRNNLGDYEAKACPPALRSWCSWTTTTVDPGARTHRGEKCCTCPLQQRSHAAQKGRSPLFCRLHCKRLSNLCCPRGVGYPQGPEEWSIKAGRNAWCLLCDPLC